MDCPNCLTPWKCNGPHLTKLSNGWYSSYEGFFIKEIEWKFLPNEMSLSTDQLLDIINTLNILNENES